MFCEHPGSCDTGGPLSAVIQAGMAGRGEVGGEQR